MTLLALPALACSTVSRTVGSVTGATQKEEMRAKLAETHVDVMRLADAYAAAVLQAASRLPAGTPEERIRVLGYQIDQLTGAYQIATGPNPLVNAIDLAVLATMSRNVLEGYWMPAVWGEDAQPLHASYQVLEPKSWALVARVLAPEQVQRLRDMVEQYHSSYPNLRQAASVRLSDIAADVAGRKTGGLGSPSEVLGSLGLDVFGGLDPAVKQVEEARMLAERALFYTQRWPRLLDMQAQVLTLQLAGQPATQQVLGDTDRISRSAELVAQTAARLPDVIDRQREAAIGQLLDAIREQEGQARALLAEMKQTLDAGNAAATSVNGVLRSADVLLASVSTPPPPGSPPAKPFEIAEYTQALVELGKTAQELEALVASLDREVPRVQAALGQVTGDASEKARALVDYAFRRGVALVLLLVGLILAAAIVYRWAAARIARQVAPGPQL